MRKRLFVFLLAACAALALPAASLMATVIPPIGLAPGSQYQLIFVTADPHNAVNTDIMGYNSFVATEAALGEPFGLPSGVTWNAVASTSAFNANANALSGALPVYNTAGQEVTAPGVGIYTGTLDNVVGFDQYGGAATVALSTNIWTGSDQFGVAVPGATLGGSGNAEVGQLATDSTWLKFAKLPKSGEVTFSRPLYALSTAITLPTPEPATLTLLGSALLVIGARRCFRRRRQRAGGPS
jgi:hypothetical protein